MKRLPLVAAAIAALVVLGVLSSIATQGFRELAAAEAERARLRTEKRALEADIARLESTLEALDSDPEAIETLARRELDYIRPGERVLLLATPTPPPPVALTVPEPTPILSLRGSP